jgi:hypothetical protein
MEKDEKERQEKRRSRERRKRRDGEEQVDMLDSLLCSTGISTMSSQNDFFGMKVYIILLINHVACLLGV